MKALKVLIIVLATLCGIAFLLPKDFTVTRTIEINASIADVFKQVNTLSNWSNWSAWHKMDPNASYTYSNTDAGVGAFYSFEGDPELIGSGSLTILESTENESISTEVIFLKEGEEIGRGNGEWAFKEENGVTQVCWSFLGDMGNNPVARWIGLMMDSMLGPQLERGLINIKEYLESPPKEEVVEEPPAESLILD